MEGFRHPSALFPLRRQLLTLTHLKAGPRGGWFKGDGNNISESGAQAVVTLPPHPSGPAREQDLGLGQRGAHRNVDLPYRQAAASSDPGGLARGDLSESSGGLSSRPLFWPTPPKASP